MTAPPPADHPPSELRQFLPVKVSMGFAAWLSAALAAVMPAPAMADVIEVGADGASVTYAGPMIYTRAGATPVQRPAPDADLTNPAPVGRPSRTDGAVHAPATLAPVIHAAARRYGLDPALVDAVAWQESRYRHDAVSPKGALGVMQLMPGTARDLGVDPYDVAANVMGGAAFLRAMLDRFGQDEALALAAYNAGPGAVIRHRGIPPFRETRNYVAQITNALARRRSLDHSSGHEPPPATQAGPTDVPSRPLFVIDVGIPVGGMSR